MSSCRIFLCPIFQQKRTSPIIRQHRPSGCSDTPPLSQRSAGSSSPRSPPDARHSPSFRRQFAPPSEPTNYSSSLIAALVAPSAHSLTSSPPARSYCLLLRPTLDFLQPRKRDRKREVHPPTRSSRSTVCYIDAMIRFTPAIPTVCISRVYDETR